MRLLLLLTLLLALTSCDTAEPTGPSLTGAYEGFAGPIEGMAFRVTQDNVAVWGDVVRPASSGTFGGWTVHGTHLHPNLSLVLIPPGGGSTESWRDFRGTVSGDAGQITGSLNLNCGRRCGERDSTAAVVFLRAQGG